MEIQFDRGVNLNKISPMTVFGFFVAKEVLENHEVTHIRVTSVVRPKGKKKSYHEEGECRAIDFKVRTNSSHWDVIEETFCEKVLLPALKSVLDEQYDIIYHADSDGVGKHFHMEFDPK